MISKGCAIFLGMHTGTEISINKQSSKTSSRFSTSPVLDRLIIHKELLDSQ